jgi:hypothetical protein
MAWKIQQVYPALCSKQLGLDLVEFNISSPYLKSKKEGTIMKTLIRKNKAAIGVLAGIGILLIAGLLLVSTTPARAETVKYNYTTQLTKLEYVPLPDVQGHIAAVFERRGVAIFENEVAAVTITGTTESTKGIASFRGYAVTTYEDGSTTLAKVSGSKTSASREKLRSYEEMKGEFIGGTGRFAGIKGNLSCKGREITPYTKDETKQDNWIEVTATYTLPKK